MFTCITFRFFFSVPLGFPMVIMSIVCPFAFLRPSFGFHHCSRITDVRTYTRMVSSHNRYVALCVFTHHMRNFGTAPLPRSATGSKPKRYPSLRLHDLGQLQWFWLPTLDCDCNWTMQHQLLGLGQGLPVDQHGYLKPPLARTARRGRDRGA